MIRMEKYSKHRKASSWLFMFLLLGFLCFPQWSKAQFYSVHTNALEWGMGTLNVGGSMLINPRWTVSLNLACNPWMLANNKKIKHWLIEPGARYWTWQSYVGSFWEAYGIGTRFNMGWKKNRFDGYGFGAGVSYGHAWLIGRRWNIEAQGGIGALVVNRKKFEGGCCGDYVSQGTYLRPAPKFALNVVYLF